MTAAAPRPGLVAVARAGAPALLVAALLLAPFHDKAFTVDDTLFLEQARHALVDPLHPTAFELVWTDVPARVSSIMPSGPVMAWLLAPVVRAGAPEWLAHAEQAALLGLGLLATVALGLRLGLGERVARRAALLLAATPVVLAMATTSMPDVPSMTLGVLALERLVAWRDGARPWQALAAAAALALATLARSHLVLLLGVGALVLVGEWPSPRALAARWRALARGAAPLALAPVLVLALLRVTRDPTPGAVDAAGAARGFVTGAYVVRHLVAFATHQVAALPLAAGWFLARGRRFPLAPLWTTVPLAVVGLELTDTMRWWYAAPLAGLGAAVLFDVLADAVRRRDALQLQLGAWLFVALPLVVYVHLPPKYLVASAPAAALLVARALERRSPALVAGLVAAGAALGLLIATADARFADLGRRAARDLVGAEVARGRRVWFAPHWGFQWYAARAGGRSFTRTPPLPATGDLLVTSADTDGPPVDAAPPRHLVRVYGDRTPGGRTMSFVDGAGFYTDHRGYLPWAYGDHELDELRVWEIE